MSHRGSPPGRGEVVATREMTDGQVTLGEGLAPLADLLDRLAGAAEPLLLTVVPLDGSPAMAEFAGEAPFRSPRWDTPLMNATSFASMAGYAAIDATRAYAHLLRHPRLLVWAPMINARAGLEAAATAFWLIEPGIAVEQRVQRGLAYRLHNARGQQRAPEGLTAARDAGNAAVQIIREVAGVNGWTISGRKQPQAKVGDEELPRPREGIRTLLSYRQGPERGAVADVSWWYYSGLTHAAPYALGQAIDRDGARPTGVGGLSEAALMTDGTVFVVAAVTLGHGLANLTEAHATRLGLDSRDIVAIDAELTEQVAALLEAIDRGKKETGSDPIG